MQQNNFLGFLEEVTKKMSETFKSLHEMCENQLKNAKKPSSNQPKIQISHPQSQLLAMLQKNNLLPQIIKKPSHMSNGHTKKQQKNAQVHQQNLQSPKKQPKAIVDNQNESEAQDSKQQLKKLRKKQKQELKQQEKLLKSDKQKRQQKTAKKMKPISHKPKAPTSSFLLFFKEQQQIIAKNYPNYGVVQLTKVAALCWNNLSVQQKQPYQKLFEVQRKKYQQQMQIYRREFPEQIKQKSMRKKQKKNKPKIVKENASNNKQSVQNGSNKQKQLTVINNYKQKTYMSETPGNVIVKIESLKQSNMIPEQAAQDQRNIENVIAQQELSEYDDSDGDDDDDMENSLGDII